MRSPGAYRTEGLTEASVSLAFSKGVGTASEIRHPHPNPRGNAVRNSGFGLQTPLHLGGAPSEIRQPQGERRPKLLNLPRRRGNGVRNSPKFRRNGVRNSTASRGQVPYNSLLRNTRWLTIPFLYPFYP